MNRSEKQLPFGIPLNLAFVAIAMLIWGLGESLFIFFLPLTFQRWDTDAVQIGAVLSMIGVTMAFVQAPAGYLSDRFGTRPVILAGMLVGITAAVLMAVARTLPLFVFGLLAYGSTSFIVAPMNSYITRLRGSWSVQRAVTFVSASVQVGAILGPALGGRIADSAGISALFRYSAGLFLASTLMIYFATRPLGQAPQDTAIKMVSPLANPRFLGLLAVVFFTIVALSVPQQMTSLYLQDVHQLSIRDIGTMGTVASIGTAVVMFSLGGLRAPTGMLIGQLLIAAFALLMWRGNSVTVFITGNFFFGGYRLYRAMAVAFSSSLVKAGDIGLAYGLVETGNAAAMIVAPLAAGVLYNFRPETVYTASLAALAFTALLNVLLLREKRRATSSGPVVG